MFVETLQSFNRVFFDVLIGFGDVLRRDYTGLNRQRRGARCFFKLLLCQRSHANQLSHQTLNGSYSSSSRGSNRLGGSHDLER